MLRPKHTRRILQTAVLASSLLPACLASAADKVWNQVGAGTWSTGSNWSPNGAPSLGDNVFIGDPLLVGNGQVYLNVAPVVSKLSMTNGMMLDTKGFTLQVTNELRVETFLTNWSQILLRNAANPFDLHVKDMNVLGVDSRIWAIDDPTIFVTGKATFGADTSLFGGAVLNFTGDTGPVFVMDGQFSGNAISSWTLNQLGDGRIDLDGTQILDTITLTSGNGSVFQTLNVNGTTLWDDFDDIVKLGPGNTLNMNLSEGWTLGGNGALLIQYAVNSSFASQINGGTMTVNGTIEFEDFSLAVGISKAAINAPVIFNPAAEVLVGGRDILDVNGATTINGGRFILSGQGNNQINFNGPTDINAGTFTTNAGYTNSFINFNGATDFSGTITINGDARQNGNAVVNSAAVINADILDMDGVASLTKWDINAPLTINADQLDLTDNLMSGTIDISSSFLFPASLTVNLPGDEQWIAGGRLNVTGSGVGVSTSLAGSDVGIGGEAFVTKANSFAARVDFLLGSLTTINTDGSLFLNGGTIGDPNTIAGGRITGAGKLRAVAGHALVGSGTIATAVDFDDDSRILARDGTLTITGAIEDVGVIGTANATGVLNLPQAFNTAVANLMSLNGGTVTGLTLVNGGTIQGRGAIISSQLNNTGLIAADGNGTLTINTGFVPDLDGSNESGTLEAKFGNIHVIDQLADSFNGTARLAEKQTLRFDGGWTLAAGGQLNVEPGPAGQVAKVIAPSQNIAGAVNVDAGATVYFDAKTTFQPTSVTTLESALAKIELHQDGTITTGATFVTPGSNSGQIATSTNAKLFLANGANVDAYIFNEGTMSVAGAAAGTAVVETLFQSSFGETQISLLGPTPGTQYDRINIGKNAGFDGNVALNTSAYNPAYLVPHEVIDTGTGVITPFHTVSGMVVSPTKYLAVTYDADTVFVTAALPGDATLNGTVDISDFAIVGSGFNTEGTWVNGDFNGDYSVDIGDFALLAANFNVSIPADLPRGAAVPEPACGMAALVGCLAVTRRNRRR